MPDYYTMLMRVFHENVVGVTTAGFTSGVRASIIINRAGLRPADYILAG
ncbi:MAG: hypothetical protein ACUVRS_05550 [Armatimonadota bacterium]